MKYLLIIFIVLLICQTLKFFIRFFSKKQINKKIIWAYFWATGAPSAHSAVLTSGLLLIYRDSGFSSIFIFCLVVSLILMYNLIADKKREEIREQFLVKGGEIDKEIVLSGKVMDISGHSFFDIVMGIMVGLFTTLLLLSLF